MARRRLLLDDTNNTHKRKSFTPPMEFEPPVEASDRAQILALDRVATEIGKIFI